MHLGSRRAFTAIELMNLLGFVAVLGALGMYGLARYVRYAKTVEAVGSLEAIAARAAEHYDTSDAAQPAGASPAAAHAMRHFPLSSRTPVPADQDSVRGRRYQSNLADWSTSPWRELRFSVGQPQCYRYAFEAHGAGATAQALVTAEGDLDGDGLRSFYSLEIRPDASLQAQVATTMTKSDPEE